MNNSNSFLDGIKKVLGYAFILFILFTIVMFLFGVWNFVQFIKAVLIVIVGVMSLVGLAYILYHSIFERRLCERNREASKVVLTEDMGKTRQVSGDTRAGKDTSVVGSSKLIDEAELERDLDEMEHLREILYIYDFKKLHAYLEIQGKTFLVSGKDRLLRKFARAMITNDSFIRSSIIKNQKVDPINHIKSYIANRETKVQRFRYMDGLTPGGIPFAQLLFEYIVIYTYRIYVTNFVMSNQPILEALEIDKKGNIKKTFSKVFNHNYMKIKLDGPLPYPLRGVIIQTEMAIMLSNVDGINAAAAKSINGIREFFTIVGHILQERVYIYDIVQDPNRQILAVRELYQTYIHVFKKTEACTSPVRRWIHEQLISIQKSKLSIQYVGLKLAKDKSLRHKTVERNIDQIKESIYKHHERIEKLNSDGYLKLHMGVYSNLYDVKKKVRFAKFKVKRESDNETIISTAFGFVLYIRKNDSYGRFNTHFMEWIREQKQNKYGMHFYDVENWDTFEVTAEKAINTGYIPMKELATTEEAKLTDDKKRKKQIDLLLEVQKRNPTKFKEALKKSGVYNESLQVLKAKAYKRLKVKLPLLDNLSITELLNYSMDLGQNIIDPRIEMGNTINLLINTATKTDGSLYVNLTIDEIEQSIKDLVKKNYDNQLCVLPFFYEEWRNNVQHIIIGEIQKWQTGNSG